ncbi:hypothetical protein C5167_013746 [Papaver somniferum]|uniref:Uncharacterized protein n=1 Tax=Papaver somniferum TaxID=3469 RepID=A0A4Y7J266_PAPSO|nr:hypothetical protein C5167_013746 [Papaver somniferum]
MGLWSEGVIKVELLVLMLMLVELNCGGEEWYSYEVFQGIMSQFMAMKMGSGVVQMAEEQERVCNAMCDAAVKEQQEKVAGDASDCVLAAMRRIWHWAKCKADDNKGILPGEMPLRLEFSL